MHMWLCGQRYMYNLLKAQNLFCTILFLRTDKYISYLPYCTCVKYVSILRKYILSLTTGMTYSREQPIIPHNAQFLGCGYIVRLI